MLITKCLNYHFFVLVVGKCTRNLREKSGGLKFELSCYELIELFSANKRENNVLLKS